MKTYTDRILNRLERLINEIRDAHAHDPFYYDRLREFKHYCDTTPVIASCLAQLPQISYDFNVGRRNLKLPDGKAGYASRWDAIKQVVIVNNDSIMKLFFVQVSSMSNMTEARTKFTELFVISLYNYLVNQIKSSSAMLYLLLRYKRWAEWFEAERLRKAYKEAERTGEKVLDSDLRRFLFESGIDYPYSQPRSPGGQADIVAGLETDDPLVLEVKVWDSEKSYKKDRVRDGLRQVMDYAEKYGKDKGYVVMFNLDPKPLVFVSEVNPGEWPARIEQNRTYYFIDINIAEQKEPVSQRDEGKPVKRNEVQLRELWNNVKND